VSFVLGLVFLVAWLLGMVQLFGYAARAFRAVFSRFSGSRAAVPPPVAEPPQHRRFFGGRS